MSEQNEKLTAEEMTHMGTHRDIIVDLHRAEIEHHGAIRSFKNGFEEGYELAAMDKNQTVADHQKATAELRAILENKLIGEKEGNALHASDAYYEIANMLEVKAGGSVIEAVDELREELERWKQKYDDIYTGHKDAIAKVEKERDEKEDLLDGQYHYNVGQDIEIGQLQTQLAEAQRQRDEAAALIKRYLSRKADDNILVAHDLDMDCEEWISRLSSGETKPNE